MSTVYPLPQHMNTFTSHFIINKHPAVIVDTSAIISGTSILTQFLDELYPQTLIFILAIHQLVLGER